MVEDDVVSGSGRVCSGTLGNTSVSKLVRDLRENVPSSSALPPQPQQLTW